MLKKLFKEIKNINRLKQILIVLFENGFGYFVDRIGLKSLIPLRKRVKLRLKKLKPEQRLRITLEKLGPTFVKLGQLLSLRPDILPLSYIKELSKLQDNVIPFGFDEVKKEIETELRKPLKEIFANFEEKPFASASVAQVHKAKLNNKLVAVKIQRPNVKEIMEEDIQIMSHLVALLEKNKVLHKYQPLKIIEEFAGWTKKELDFTNEAYNAEKIRNNFKGSNVVVIPAVFRKYTTKRILTLEYIKGIELKDVRKLKEAGFDIEDIMRIGLDAILTQIFIHGFFHADPHPGNIIITKEGKIAFVDFGIFGKFDEKLRKESIKLFEGIITNDIDEIVDSLLKIGSVKKGFNEEDFKEEIKNVIKPLQGVVIKDVKISTVLEDVLGIALKYEIRLPLSFVLFGKTIVTLEGVALEYCPNFKIIENSQPFIEKLIKEEFSIRDMAKESMKTFVKFRKFVKEFPEQVTNVLKTLQEGRVKIDIKDSDIKGLSLEIDKSSNRLAYGMIIAALIVAGALVVNVGMPKVFGLPVISFLCFALAGVLGLLLLKSILGERKLQR